MQKDFAWQRLHRTLTLRQLHNMNDIYRCPSIFGKRVVNRCRWCFGKFRLFACELFVRSKTARRKSKIVGSPEIYAPVSISLYALYLLDILLFKLHIPEKAIRERKVPSNLDHIFRPCVFGGIHRWRALSLSFILNNIRYHFIYKFLYLQVDLIPLGNAPLLWFIPFHPEQTLVSFSPLFDWNSLFKM